MIIFETRIICWAGLWLSQGHDHPSTAISRWPGTAVREVVRVVGVAIRSASTPVPSLQIRRLNRAGTVRLVDHSLRARVWDTGARPDTYVLAVRGLPVVSSLTN